VCPRLRRANQTGWAACVDSTSCGTESSWLIDIPSQLPSNATAMRISRYTFDVVYSPFNATILSMTNIGPPVTTQSFSPDDFYTTFGAVFGDSTNSYNTTTGSLVAYIAGNIHSGLSSETEAELNNIVQGVMILPLIDFQANGYLNRQLANTPFSLENPIPGLPRELYTTIESAKIVPRVLFSSWTVLVYLLMGGFFYTCCIVALIWVHFVDGPESSKFPLIDFAARAVANKTNSALTGTLERATGGYNDTVEKEFGNMRLRVRGIGNGEEGNGVEGGVKIVLTREEGGNLLRSGNMYLE
jgi:hypothetical protein